MALRFLIKQASVTVEADELLELAKEVTSYLSAYERSELILHMQVTPPYSEAMENALSPGYRYLDGQDYSELAPIPTYTLEPLPGHCYPYPGPDIPADQLQRLIHEKLEAEKKFPDRLYEIIVGASGACCLAFSEKSGE